MSYSFERIGKLLEERELRLAALQAGGRQGLEPDGLRELSRDGSREGVQAALTHDQDFRQAGFEVLRGGPQA